MLNCLNSQCPNSLFCKKSGNPTVWLSTIIVGKAGLLLVNHSNNTWTSFTARPRQCAVCLRPLRKSASSNVRYFWPLLVLTYTIQWVDFVFQYPPFRLVRNDDYPQLEGTRCVGMEVSLCSGYKQSHQQKLFFGKYMDTAESFQNVFFSILMWPLTCATLKKISILEIGMKDKHTL